MLTPELHISTDFTADDHIGSETLRAYCAELKKTKVVIFALCGRGEMADALASGASGGYLMVVQIHSAAPLKSICGCGGIGRRATLRG